MKVVLYYPWIYLKGGIEKVILEIVKRSRHEWTIFTNHFDSENSYEEFKYFNIVVLKQVPVKRDIISVFKLILNLFSFPYKLIDKFAWKYYEKVYVNSKEVKRRVIQGGLSKVEKL